MFPVYSLRASLRFEKRLNFSISPRKLLVLSQSFLNRSEPQSQCNIFLFLFSDRITTNFLSSYLLQTFDFFFGIHFGSKKT